METSNKLIERRVIHIIGDGMGEEREQSIAAVCFIFRASIHQLQDVIHLFPTANDHARRIIRECTNICDTIIGMRGVYVR